MVSSIIKNVITMLMVAAGMYAFYLVASNPELRAKMFPSAEKIAENASELEKDVLSNLTSVEGISLQQDIFSTVEFEALVEKKPTEPKDVTYSRNNPFEPY